MWKLLFALVSLVVAIGTQGSFAQESRPVQLIFPYAAGSSTTDIAAGLLAGDLGNTLRQPVIVDNKPGANAVVAANAVLQAPADGNTVMLVGPTPFLIAPVLSPEALPFDAAREFTMVSYAFFYPLVLLASPQSGVKNLKDLMQAMRGAEEPNFFGSVGPSSPIQLAKPH
jgi:tripartite-type tricarboxylate transporter receptor subunit TctC